MSNLLEDLNLSQQEAVTHTIGPLLIIAGPGSGKTRTVVDSIIYAIKKRGMVPNRIVAFTFTRKAVAELKERVSKAVGENIARDIRISTFHSFCGTVLYQDIEKLGIGNTQEFTFKELTRIYEERIRSQIDYIQHHKFVDAEEIRNFITECKTKGIHSSKIVDYAPSPQMSQAYVEIDKRYKQIQADTDNYTRAQLFTKALFRDVPEVKTKWQEEFDLIFVDEYQDTDLVQYQIIKNLAEKHQNLRVVGDDDQGIYGWRGANIQNILNFEKDYPNAKVISLGQNYRSTQQIVDASRAIIDFNPDRRTKNLFTNNTEGYKVKHLHCEDNVNEAATIADFIHRAIQQGWTARDFAVLCRSTKGQAIYFEEAFSKSGIPFHVVEDSSKILTNGVSIMTIHKSKGLEFPNVFVAGVCSGLLPYYKSKEEDWDEELRLLYVAMTRAENWLCLSSYEKDYKNTSFKRGPSRFLDFIPPSLIENIKTLDNTLIPSRLKKRIVVEDTEKSPKDATSLPIRPQAVLGIDPGKENVGWSITQRLPDAYTVFRCDTEKPYGQPIERKINELVMRHSPDAIAVEKLEGATDEWFRDIAGCVAQIRSIADQQDIECHFYSPQDVKYAVTGNKKASKEEVQQAVRQVCNLKEIPEPHHSADAIATGLCYLRNYLNYSRFQNNTRKQEHYNAGSTYLDNKQYNKAIIEFKEAINNASMIDPMYTKAHCGLAHAYLGQDKLEPAEKSAKEALRLKDNYDLALRVLESIKQKYCERGRAYLNQDDLAAAEKSANEALRLDSCYQFAHELLDAIKQAHYNQGREHLNNKQYDEAIDAFTKTINKYSNFIAAHCGLGLVYLRQGKLEKAEKVAKQVSELDSAHLSVHELLDMIKRTHCDRGRTCLEQGNLEAAKKSVVEALKFEYDNWSLHIIRSPSIQIGILKRGTNYQPARELLDLIKQAHYNRGCRHLNKKQYNEAALQFRIVADMEPEYKNVHNYLGYAYYWIHNFKNSIRSYRTAIAINSNDKNAYVMLGLGHISAGNYSKAVSPFQEAINIDPNHKQAHLCLGRTYFKIGKLEKAKQSIRKTLDIDPTYQRALQLLEEIKQREIRSQKQLARL